MRNKLNKLTEKLGKLSRRDGLEILFHPVIVPIAIIPAWAKSLWASRVLFWGQWSRYPGFHAHNAINSLFYRTQWINIDRYGRLANSPIVGLGNFPLSNWWHLSSLASYFYAYAGAVTTLLGTLFLVFSHLIWLQSANWIWVVVVTAVFFLSSTAYVMAFARQNYQILAWMFVPIGLFGLVNGQWVVGAAAFLLAAMLGVTAFVVCAYLVLIFAIYSANFQMLWTMLPAALAVSIKLLPLFVKGNTRESLLNMGKLIGLIHVKVRYKRKSMRLNLFNLYFLMLYGISLGLIWIAKQEIPIFLFGSYLLFLLNQRFMRFADDQSMILTVVVAAVLEVLVAPFNWLALLGLVVAVNPILKPLQAGGYVSPQIFTPFDTEPLLKKLRDFLSIPSGAKVIFAFDEPQGEYEKIFDGYRILLEAPLVVAAEKNIHLFPDWYAVFETNYEGAPSIWGRSVEEVRQNMNYWQADYAIIYQDSGSELSSIWRDAFEVVSEFDWLTVFDEECVRGIIAKPLNSPQWWLLKKKDSF